MQSENRKNRLRGEMEFRKDRVLTGAVSLSAEAQKDFLGICDMITNRIADDREVSADEEIRLAE